MFSGVALVCSMQENHNLEEFQRVNAGIGVLFCAQMTKTKKSKSRIGCG